MRRVGKTEDGFDTPQAISLESLSQRPLANRAQQVILEAILTNRFGSRLPSEEELARLLKVSRTTVRAALQNLERDGLINRRRALGAAINTHVGPSVLALQRLVGFDWLLREYGYEVEVAIAIAEAATPPKDFQRVFDLDAELNGYLLDKKYFADGDLTICIRDFIPAEFIVSDRIPEPVPPSLFDFSEACLTVPIDHAVVEIVPRVVGAGDGRTELDLPDGAPFIQLHERHYSNKAQALGDSIIDINTQLVRIGVFRSQ